MVCALRRPCIPNVFLIVNMIWHFLLLGGVIAGTAGARTWTSSDGKTLEADFVRLSGSQVTLRKAGGGEVTLPLSRLSAADQAFARSQPGLTVRAVPSKDPMRDAKAYAEAVAELNEAHARRPGGKTEDALADQIPAAAVTALHSVAAAADEAPGLAAALVTLGEAALDLGRSADFAIVRQRLEMVDAERARQLGQAAVGPRVVVRAVGDFAPGYADNFAALTEAVLAAYDEVFGFAEFSKVPGKKLRFRVHLEPTITRPPHFAPQFPWHSEIDFPVVQRDGLNSPTAEGHFLLYGLCHELGHVIAMWGSPQTMEDHHAWAHYTGVAVVEQLQKTATKPTFLATARDLRWRSMAIERGLKENQVPPAVTSKEGVIALLLALHDTAGPKAIGAALNWLDEEGKCPRVNRVRYYGFGDLRRALAATLGDKTKRAATDALFGK